MKLFVGNLSYDTTDGEVRELFSEYEPILDFHRPRDRETGKPRGFAFVTLDSPEVAERAMDELNDKKCWGRKLRVNEAEERRDRPPVRRVTMNEEEDPTSPKAPRVDDRPVGKDGKKVRYKGI